MNSVTGGRESINTEWNWIWNLETDDWISALHLLAAWPQAVCWTFLNFGSDLCPVRRTQTLRDPWGINETLYLNAWANCNSYKCEHDANCLKFFLCTTKGCMSSRPKVPVVSTHFVWWCAGLHVLLANIKCVAYMKKYLIFVFGSFAFKGEEKGWEDEIEKQVYYFASYQ